MDINGNLILIFFVIVMFCSVILILFGLSSIYSVSYLGSSSFGNVLIIEDNVVISDFKIVSNMLLSIVG